MRIQVTLKCEGCNRRNYITEKNKIKTQDKLQLRKHCPFCRKHTLHVETK